MQALCNDVFPVTKWVNVNPGDALYSHCIKTVCEYVCTNYIVSPESPRYYVVSAIFQLFTVPLRATIPLLQRWIRPSTTRQYDSFNKCINQTILLFFNYIGPLVLSVECIPQQIHAGLDCVTDIATNGSRIISIDTLQAAVDFLFNRQLYDHLLQPSLNTTVFYNQIYMRTLYTIAVSIRDRMLRKPWEDNDHFISRTQTPNYKAMVMCEYRMFYAIRISGDPSFHIQHGWYAALWCYITLQIRLVSVLWHLVPRTLGASPTNPSVPSSVLAGMNLQLKKIEISEMSSNHRKIEITCGMAIFSEHVPNLLTDGRINMFMQALDQDGDAQRATIWISEILPALLDCLRSLQNNLDLSTQSTDQIFVILSPLWLECGGRTRQVGQWQHNMQLINVCTSENYGMLQECIQYIELACSDQCNTKIATSFTIVSNNLRGDQVKMHVKPRLSWSSHYSAAASVDKRLYEGPPADSAVPHRSTVLPPVARYPIASSPDERLYERSPADFNVSPHYSVAVSPADERPYERSPAAHDDVESPLDCDSFQLLPCPIVGMDQEESASDTYGYTSEYAMHTHPLNDVSPIDHGSQ